MSGMADTLSDVEGAVVNLAARDGRKAGREFLAKYDLGKNIWIDKMIHEGIETNVSLIVQRLPWATVIPAFGQHKAIRDLLIRIHIDPDAIDREVVDALVWTYMVAYDKASRKVILNVVSHERDSNGLD